MDIYSFVLSFILLNSSVLIRIYPGSSVAKIRIANPSFFIDIRMNLFYNLKMVRNDFQIEVKVKKIFIRLKEKKLIYRRWFHGDNLQSYR